MKYLIIFLNISIFAFSNNISAQNSNSEIEEIVVTASLIPISIKESASAITVINNNELKNRSVSSISDLLRNVPGVAVSRSGVLGSQTQIRMRGAEANHLLVLIDGIEANNSSQSDEFNWGTLSNADIERIEVIRGPQSSMYGSDAMSGVINIITSRATKPKSLSIISERGSFSSSNNGISLGYLRDGLDAYIGLNETLTEGDNISRFGFEKDGYKNRNVSIKSGVKINKKLKALISARYSNGMNEYDSDTDYDGLIEDQNNVAKFKKLNISLKADHINSNKTWQQNFLINQSKDDNDDFNNGILGISTSSTKEQLKYINTIFLDEFKHRFSFLVEHEREKFQQSGFVLDYGIYGIYDPNQHQNRKTNSIAFEYRENTKKNFSYSISSRRDFNSEFRNANTYRLEAFYVLSADTKLRSAFGTAIKNPTFTERFGYYTNFKGNPLLEPESSSNWEIGYDRQLNSGKQSISITIFDSALENEIDGNVYDASISRFTAMNKNNTSKRKGVELNFLSNINDNLILSFSHTYTNSRELDQFGEYKAEVRRPKNISSLNLSWQLNNKANFSGNIQHTGSQYDIAYPNIIKLSDFTIVNLSVNLNVREKMEAYMRLENILDESYEEVYGYKALGFGAYLGLRLKL